MNRILKTLSALAVALGAVAIAGSGIASAAAAGQPTEVDRTAAVRGERTFRTFCASCHGREAKGDGPLAKDLKASPADLTQLAAKNEGTFPFQMVIDTIQHGRNVRGHGTQDMPAWGDTFNQTSESKAAADAKMDEVAHYLWSLQKK